MAARPLLLFTVSLGFLLSCRTYYHTYREANPTWEFAFPREGMPLDELVASIVAPRRHAPYGEGHVKTVRLFETNSDPPTEISIESLEAGEFRTSQNHDYLVGVRVACTEPGYDVAFVGEGFFWYLLESNRLVGYQQVSFYGLCWLTDPKELAPEMMDPEQYEWLQCRLTGRCN